MRTCTGGGQAWWARQVRWVGLLGDRRVSDLPGPRPTRPTRPTRLLRSRFRLAGQEALNLFHRVIDLDVEGHLAERGGRAAGVSADAVVLARRRVGIGRGSAAARAWRGHRVALGGRDVLPPPPPLFAPAVKTRGRLRDGGVGAGRRAVRR